MKEVATGLNLTDEQRSEFIDLATQFSSQFTEVLQTSPSITSNLPQMTLFRQVHIPFLTV